MDDSLSTDSRSPSTRGITTRADPGPNNNTAQPSLTSGFGAVMKHEYDIQSATTRYLDGNDGPCSDEADRLLRQHQGRLGANIALLEQRYALLPEPARFQALHERQPRTRPSRNEATARVSALTALVAQHLKLLENIDALMAGRPDGQRGLLILAEVARNHEQMAWALTALRKTDGSVRDQVPMPVIAGEGRWENEGGSLRMPHAAVAATRQQLN
jgi:hypothetical protein